MSSRLLASIVGTRAHTRRPAARHHGGGRSRLTTPALLLGLCAALVAMLAPLTSRAGAAAQMPDADAPLAEPVVDAEAVFAADRVRAWENAAGSRFLLLDGQVRYELGAFGFRAERALVRIDTQPRLGGAVRHLAVYLDQARPLRGQDQGPVTAEAPRLLVTVSTRGTVAMETNLMQPVEGPPGDDLVREGVARIKRHYARLSQPVLSMPNEPLLGPAAAQRRTARHEASEPKPQEQPATSPEATTVAEATQPTDQGTPADADAAPPTAAPKPDPAQALLPTRGVLRYNFDSIVVESGETEAAAMVIGDVRLVYQDYEIGRTVSLQAERAVIFLDPDAGEQAQSGQIRAGAVQGIYLEDNVVISDGEYTVRAPRVYYDLAQNKAILLEAVLYTYDVQLQIPLYLRAQVLQQTSQTSFEARDALLTTSAFAEPHIAIGASRLALTQAQPETSAAPGSPTVAEREPRYRFSAEHTTLQVGGLPAFYWPHLAGDVQSIPLRSVEVGYSNQNGYGLLTRWDLFALSGRDRPSGVELTGALDYRGDHGPATGVALEYERDSMVGNFESYLLPSDSGTDKIGDRSDIEHDNDARGFFRWVHRQELANDWSLKLEAAYVSDETFLEEFFPEEAYEAKTYETSLYIQKAENDWAADLVASTQLNEFTPQLTTLQTPGYTVEKMPELGYFRVGTPLMDGRLTWFSENRIGWVRAVFGEDTPGDRGFRNAASQALFGIPANTSFEDAARASGFPRDWRLRVDSRQEISAPLRVGILDVVPYAAGRITAYDDDFEEFNGDSDRYRLWGTVGTRLHTTFQRTYANVESDLLDVHRLRHIIEPTLDVFVTGSTLDPEDLPIYDFEVEGISEGGGVRLGLTNTLQTQRGGPGRWRSVDWLTLQTDLVLRSDDADIDAEIPRFYGYRPEFSTGGDHFYTRLLWLVSDTLGVVGELTHSFEEDQIVQWRLGGTLQHSARLSSFVNYQEIDVLDSQLLSYGFTYQLTSKYTLSFAQRLDFSEDESQNLDIWIERRMPQVRLRLLASFDEIDDEQTIGIVLIPEGASSTRSPAMFY